MTKPRILPRLSDMALSEPVVRPRTLAEMVDLLRVECEAIQCPPLEDHTFDAVEYTPSTFKQMIDHIAEAGRRYQDEWSIGSEQNPYILTVPGWLEDRCIAEGTTAQAVADETFRYHTKVVVVR